MFARCRPAITEHQTWIWFNEQGRKWNSSAARWGGGNGNVAVYPPWQWRRGFSYCAVNDKQKVNEAMTNRTLVRVIRTEMTRQLVRQTRCDSIPLFFYVFLKNSFTCYLKMTMVLLKPAHFMYPSVYSWTQPHKTKHAWRHTFALLLNISDIWLEHYFAAYSHITLSLWDLAV